MKNLLLILPILLLLSCSKDKGTTKSSDQVPACLAQRIHEIESEPPADPRAEIWRYDYNGKTVYHLLPSCCDQMSELYDDRCNLICHPDGGITGQGDGNCTDFFSTRQNGVMMWKDTR